MLIFEEFLLLLNKKEVGEEGRETALLLEFSLYCGLVFAKEILLQAALTVCGVLF